MTDDSLAAAEKALLDIRGDILMCKRCPLHADRNKAVPGAGSPRASIALIGEAPGRNEDREGVPFIGNAGKKLDEWLDAAGLLREHLFITNVLHCLPTDGFPQDDQTAATVDRCRDHLERQLAVVKPAALILLGKQALAHVLLRGTTEQAAPFDKWVGQVCRRRDLFGEARIGVAWHPAYILRKWSAREESACISVFKKIRAFVLAKQKGEPAPLTDLHEIRPAAPTAFQHRLHLFGEGSAT